MLLRKLWISSRILLHFLWGMAQVYFAGMQKDRRQPRDRETVRRWYKGMLDRLDIEVNVLGTVPHENQGALIFVANHISWVDIPLIGSLTPVNFLSKAEVAQWPLVGPVATRIGTLYISRGSGDTDAVMRQMSDHLQRNQSVLVFPEGTTTDGSKVRRFHKKLFKVCEVAQVTVCPLFVRYESDAPIDPVPFIGDVGFGSHFWQMLGRGKIRATVEVMSPVELDPAVVGHQMRGIELAMRDKLAVNGVAGDTISAPTASSPL